MIAGKTCSRDRHKNIASSFLPTLCLLATPVRIYINIFPGIKTQLSIDEDLVMLQFNDSIEYQEEEVVDDAFDEELGAFEKMFGALEDLSEIEELDDMKHLKGEFNFMDALGELDA